MESTEEPTVKKKKIPPGSIKLQMAGDLLLARCTDRSLSQLFRRYETLLETLANMDRDERLLNYKFLIGLVLTSFAKKCTVVEDRKKVFDLKNAIFLNLVNNKETRKKIALRYLVSKNFRVLDFCKKCNEKNNEAKLPRHQWKFCKDCNVDRKFYNVLSIHHKFNNGSATLFLSNDLIEKVEGLKLNNKSKLDDFKEEAKFEKYHYNVKNLDVFNLEDVKKVHSKLISIVK